LFTHVEDASNLACQVDLRRDLFVGRSET